VLRKKSDTRVCVSTTAMDWQHFGTLVTLKHTRLLGYWETGEKEPWLLMTNIPEPHIALKTYRKRMWIEEMFGDFKGHGLGHTCAIVRVPRASSFSWPLVGHPWLTGDRHLVDRRDRASFASVSISSTDFWLRDVPSPALFLKVYGS
jgi:hypothetical protein